MEEAKIDVPAEVVQKLRTHIGSGIFGSKARAQAVVIESARRVAVGEFWVRCTTVRREQGTGEEAVKDPPAAAPRVIEPWAVEWPASREAELNDRTIDAREHYELYDCAACGRSGETRCGVCGGSGKVANPAQGNRPAPCVNCDGRGTSRCPRCRGSGRLLRFLRIKQTVECQTQRVTLPQQKGQDTVVPVGHPSGTIVLGEPGGFTDPADAREALLRSAPGIPAEFIENLASAMIGTQAGRPGWCAVEGRWYTGWAITGREGTRSLQFVVPDSPALVAGPNLKSARRVLVAVGATLLFLVGSCVGLGVVVKQGEVLRAERARQTAENAKVEADRKEAEHVAANEAAAKRDAEEMRAAAESFTKDKSAYLAEIENLESLTRKRTFDPDDASAKLKLVQAKFDPLLRSEVGTTPTGDGLRQRVEKQRNAIGTRREALRAEEAQRQAKAQAEAEREQAKASAKAEAEAKRAQARSAREQQKATVALRAAYGKTLRENFLDKNLDIKVRVHGDDNTSMTLTFVLFSDVWIHKFGKGDLLEEIRGLGFKKVVLYDGYEEYWTYDF